MGWLEWSKMEEENGELRKALNILILGMAIVTFLFWPTSFMLNFRTGLNVCKVNEALLTRVIKLHERLQRYEEFTTAVLVT
jgi:hypothetical protein